MLNFKTFMAVNEQEEEDKDILHTLSKIPKSHANLVRGYTFKLQGGNTLSGDNDHVGYIQDDPKEIVVAAPWKYSREQCFLHEVAHRVWSKLGNDWKKRWAMILARTPNQQERNEEEAFCMCYGATYSKHPPTTYSHPEWIAFIKSLPS